jgi:hypothetical protein
LRGSYTIYITSYRRAVEKRDVCPQTDLISEAHAKPDSQPENLSEHAHMVYLSNLSDLRKFEQFGEEDAVLLMDNCLNDVCEEVICLLRDIRVLGTLSSPHITQIFE